MICRVLEKLMSPLTYEYILVWPPSFKYPLAGTKKVSRETKQPDFRLASMALSQHRRHDATFNPHHLILTSGRNPESRIHACSSTGSRRLRKTLISISTHQKVQHNQAEQEDRILRWGLTQTTYAAHMKRCQNFSCPRRFPPASYAYLAD